MPKEFVQRFYTQDLALRGSVAITTQTVQHVCDIQKTSPVASMAIGRALTGAVLLASQLKEGQRLGMQFLGDGPLGSLFAESSFDGKTRAYCANPQVDVPLKNGKLDVSGAIGKGLLSVQRSQIHQKQPHSGIVPILTGEVGEDLAYYLLQSQQTPAVVALSVYLDVEGQVLAAGGVLVELMPGASDALVDELERRAREARSLSNRIFEGDDPLVLAAPFLHQPPIALPEHRYPIEYSCKCSVDRVERTLTLLGRASLAEMVIKGEPVAAKCEFCGTSFSIPVERLRELHHELDPKTAN